MTGGSTGAGGGEIEGVDSGDSDRLLVRVIMILSSSSIDGLRRRSRSEIFVTVLDVTRSGGGASSSLLLSLTRISTSEGGDLSLSLERSYTTCVLLAPEKR